MLSELDKWLEARGHRFVRYADDCMIFCKSMRAAERVRDSISRFVEGRLLLKVNREKTVVGYARGVKYLHSYIRWRHWLLPPCRHLLECGIKPYAAKLTANYRIKYWRTARSHVVQAALSNEWLRKDGYPCLMDYYVTMHRN